MVGISGLAILGLGLAAVVGAGFVAGVIWLSLRGRERKPDIPPAMRPGPADEVLERRMGERLWGWSVVFVLFFSAWLPVYWLKEPTVNVDEEVHMVDQSVERGGRWFAISDEENPTGFGCARCHGPNAEGGTTLFEGADYPVPPLNNVCGRYPIDPQQEGETSIRQTIMQGRENTPMPSWSIRFQGPMNDQQIQDLVNYLVTIQKLPPDTPNLCLDPKAGEDEQEGGAPSGGTTTGESPEPGESPTTEESPAEEPAVPSPTAPATPPPSPGAPAGEEG